jgi:hypothetical protein
MSIRLCYVDIEVLLHVIDSAPRAASLGKAGAYALKFLEPRQIPKGILSIFLPPHIIRQHTAITQFLADYTSAIQRSLHFWRATSFPSRSQPHYLYVQDAASRWLLKA